jgi:HAE1 family hydrophobic/amphiphilic exporter-1
VRASVPAATRAGALPQEVERAAQAWLHGVSTGRVSIAGDAAVDVVLHAGLAGTPTSLDDFHTYPFVSARGAIVPFGALSSIERGSTPTEIHRVDARRAVEVLVSLPPDVALDDAVEILRRDLTATDGAAGRAVPEAAFDLVGHEAAITEIRGELAWSLVATVVVTYLTLVVSFSSLRLPLAAMALVPAAAVGGLGMVAMGGAAARIDLLSAMGFAILTGVVVNNGILIIDGAQSRTAEGQSLPAALVAAARERLRPIVMTTGTTLAGVAPMLVSSGAGSELYAGISAVVLGGLSLSGVVCIFLTPAFVMALCGPARRRPTGVPEPVRRVPTQRYRTAAATGPQEIPP